jgi:endoglucanase Acf2
MKKRYWLLLLLLAVLCVLALVFRNLGGLMQSKAQLSGGTSGSPGSTSSDTPSSAHNLTPIASNQWYSNIYAQFPTEPLFALPAAFQLSQQGVSISLPTVTKTPNTIFAPYITDLTLGFSTPLQKPKIESIGDWSVQLAMATAQQEQLQFTLAQGIPFTFFHVRGSRLQLQCAVTCAAYTNNTTALTPQTQATTQALSLVIRDHTYILVFDAAHPVQLSGTSLTMQGVNRVFLGVLDTRAHYNLFRNAATTEITNTMASPHIQGHQLITTHTLTTSGSAAPLITLYPHQSPFLASHQPVLGTYSTIRGTASLVQTKTFTTSLPIDIPATNIPKIASPPADLLSALNNDITTFIQQGPPNSKDYYLGVWFGRGDNLLLMAENLGLHTQEQRLLQYMEPQFIQSMSYFADDPKMMSVIAKDPEFNNQQLDDHHFHYGYYIRTAAVLAQLDPSIVLKVQGTINQMVDDIANTNRQSTKFPYLRNFDVYEGHSWADGFAKFADGNDEESSSEAIQAWYSLYLWSQVTHNASLQTTGLYLYTTEIQSVKDYWFGLNGLYNGAYQHTMASIVWGGKVDFATWFSANPNEIYGIQLLPITPGSTYLGQLPGIAHYLSDLKAHGGSMNGTWGDLLLIWKSFYDPQQALAQKESVPSSLMNTTPSLLLYMLYAHAPQS